MSRRRWRARANPTTPARVMGAREILRTFTPYLRPQWRGWSLAALLAVAGTAVGLLKPWPLKYLFDEVLLPQRNPGRRTCRARCS